MFYGGHLGLHDDGEIYRFHNITSVYIDQQNVRLDTKIMFLCHLEAEI